MKKIKILAAGCLMLAMGSCSSGLLNLDNPNALTTTTAYTTEADINASLVGIYHSFYNSYYAMMNTLQFSGQSDESTSHSVAWVTQYVSQVYSDMNCRWNFTSYNQLYEQVARCNQVITYADNVTEWKTYDKDQMVAQAKAVRAYCYYQLAMMYQIAPYVDYVAEAGDQPKAGVFEETCQHIVDDAEYAYKTLPASYKSSDGYDGPSAWKDNYLITKWFAACVLAKTYMNWGDYLQGGYHYAEALPVFKDIVENGGFSLLADYNDNFKSDTENNAESIFEIQFGECSNTWGNYWGLTNNGSAVSTTSWRWKFLGAPPVGWNDQNAEPWVIYAFKNEHAATPTNGSEWDSRLPASVFYDGIFEDFPQHVQWGLWSSTYGRKEAGQDPTPENAGFSYSAWTSGWAYCNKYVDQYKNADEINSAGSDGTNLRIFRLGEIMLDYAECLAQTGSLSEAVAMVDKVRERAGMSPLGSRQNYKVESVWTNPETSGTTDFNAEYGYAAFENGASGDLASFMKVIDLEKLKETAYELDRFVDIRRWGISRDDDFLAKVKKRSSKYQQNFTPVRAWIPLPTDDVNNNPNLEQLPGW